MAVRPLLFVFKIKGVTLGGVQRPFSLRGILRAQAGAVQGFDAVAFAFIAAKSWAASAVTVGRSAQPRPRLAGQGQESGDCRQVAERLPRNALQQFERVGSDAVAFCAASVDVRLIGVMSAN